MNERIYFVSGSILCISILFLYHMYDNTYKKTNILIKADDI